MKVNSFTCEYYTFLSQRKYEIVLLCLNVLHYCYFNCDSAFSVLTDQRVCDVGPVNALLQFQLVMRLDVEQQVLVETHAGDQVCAVSTLQSTTAVDVLR